MIKWLAFILMLIDHIGYFFFDFIPPVLYDLMRGVGRLAMPLFAFAFAYGFLKSKNWLKYFLRLLATAIITEFIIRRLFPLIHFSRNFINIVFTFSCSLVFLIALKILINSGYDLLVRMQPIQSTGMNEGLPYQFKINLGGIELPPIIGLILGLLFMMISAGLIVRYDMEYGLYGLLIIVAFYIVLEYKPKRPMLICTILLILVNLIFQLGSIFKLGLIFDYNPIQWLTITAALICFNEREEKKPERWEKYFFYLMYPAQYIILVLLRILLI